MPTYTAPTTRTTGELISAAIFNTDLVENLKYFKDAPVFAGNVTYSTLIKSTTALATPAALTATQATAFASTVSGSAIMGFGTTNDVALMNRAGTVVLGIGPNTTTVNMTGLLTVSGFGTHSFSAGGTGSQVLSVRNTTAGQALAEIYIGNDASAYAGSITVTSSTYTAANRYPQDGLLIEGNRAGGTNIASTNASGAIRFYSGGTTLRWTINATGGLVTDSNVFTIGTVASGNDFVYFQKGSSNNIIGTAGTGAATILSFYNANGPIGSISTSGSTTAYNTSSDARLKRDLGAITQTDVLRKTIVRDFVWLSDGLKSRGVFAQEAYAVAPFAVTVGSDERKDGRLVKPWSVDYSKYVPDLIVGWQQHDATISQLAARIAALESQDN